MRLLRSFVVLLVLIVSSTLGITSAGAHGSCEASASFNTIANSFQIRARVDCTEAHAKLKIRTYVQWRSLLDPSWNNFTGLTAVNVKEQTKFISDQRGYQTCTLTPTTPPGFFYRVVVDFFNVWNSSGQHITQHEIFDGWNDNEFGFGCSPPLGT